LTSADSIYSLTATDQKRALPTEDSMTSDIAHRGSSAMAAENTVSAITLAIEQGASIVEIDVRRSSDGALVVMHDSTLTRTTNASTVFPDRAPWNVADFTLAELKQLDAGCWFSPASAGERIPTLREVIETLGPDTGLLLEVKPAEQHPGIEADVHAELSALDGYLEHALEAGRLVVQSFDIASMRAYRSIAPNVPVGLLFSPRMPPSRALLADASTWAQQINPHYSLADRALIDQIHDLGMTTSVYTVDDPVEIERVIDLGVDGVISNVPLVLREILQRSTHSRGTEGRREGSL
jgi:glycerophosphoryl diester phosphodiesterase